MSGATGGNVSTGILFDFTNMSISLYYTTGFSIGYEISAGGNIKLYPNESIEKFKGLDTWSFSNNNNSLNTQFGPFNFVFDQNGLIGGGLGISLGGAFGINLSNRTEVTTSVRLFDLLPYIIPVLKVIH